MKRIKSLGALIIAVSVLSGGLVHAQNTLTNGLVAWYPCVGNANDASGNGNNGTVNGPTLTTDRFNDPNSAYYFDGGSSSINLPGSAFNNLPQGSIATWIELDNNTQAPIFSKEEAGHNSYAIFTVGFYSGGPATSQAGEVYFVPFNGGTVASSSTLLSTGIWHHVAATFTSTNCNLYINGSLSGSASGNFSSPDDSGGAQIAIGHWYGVNVQSMLGRISDFRIYNRALSSLEVGELYSSVPVILTQPLSQTLVQGTEASLAVAVAGYSPLSYQWQLYGTNIYGATNPALTFASIQLTDAGVYSVVISNSLGIAVSSNAVLQVLPPNAPSIQVNGQLAVGTMTEVDSAQVTISGGFEDGYIFYTLDGTVPSVDSTLYSGAFTVSNSVPVQAMSLSEDFSQSAYAPAVQVQITTLCSLQTSAIGSGTITANPPTSPYLSNSVVVVTAIPATNWYFAYWTNDATGNQNPLSLTMSGPQNVGAVFLPIPFYNVQTSVVGNGSITVSPTPGPYLSNSVVVLTANPGPNWLFAYWTNGVSGTQNPLNVTMNGPVNATAVFTPTYPVTVATAGGGSVTVNGQAIAPSTYYPVGSILSLSATASNGWTFLGWQGDASGTNNPLSLTVNGTNNIQAIFGTVVATNAVGSGQIVFNLPNPVPYGTTLTASAVPNTGKYFVTWSGAASGSNSPTQITVTTANPTISGLFTTLPGGTYSLGAIVMGNGAVSITPQQNYYTAGTSVQVSAIPVPGITSFYGWTQDASGTNTPIEVLMNSNQIVQANFGSLPIVSISPSNQVVLVGNNAVLTANAAGISPLSYQWQDSEGILVGQTNAIFSIIDAQATNSDTYSVVVSNPFGSVTSAVVTVTVGIPPSIASQPSNQTVEAGSSLTLTVTANGSTPFEYQWQNSEGEIAGQTNSSLALNPALTNYTDSYSVIIANPYGAVTSEVASAFVYLPVSILSQPASQVIPYSGTASFGVTAYGFPMPTSYQWMFNGTNLTGDNSSTLTINSIRLSNTGSYQVQVNNGYSSITSHVATLNMSPSIVNAFSGATAIWGQDADFTVGAVGSGTLNYQWYFNGVAINGASLPSLNLSSIQFTNQGLYSVVVSSPYGSVTNIAEQVIVNPAGVSLGFYPGLTISGVAGYSYIIQSSTDLANTNSWLTLTNLTLTLPTQLWIDSSVDASSPFNSKTFYKILPGQ